jgi:hypothetical protein
MRVTRKPDASQVSQVAEFPIHMPGGRPRIQTGQAAEEFSNDPRLAVLIFIQIHMVGCRQLIYPESGRTSADADLREDIVPQVSIQRVIRR